MITAYIICKDKTKKEIQFTSLAEALSKVRTTLEIGDSFTIREGDKLLAKGKIEDYKEFFI